MATVYRAYDPSFEREVAIKVLPRELMHDPQFRDRFRREIKTVATLEHPAIVPVYDVGEEDGQPYLVMRYMSGGSLTQWIERGKFSMQDAARIIERLASALAFAHKNGLVHRDLKPDNILFDNNGDPYISDFGVAKITDSATNLTGSGIIGTPAYMSPEQAQGEHVDSRSDIYGLGVIIFQMLSGHQPYEATTPMGVAVKHITDPVPDILKVDPSLPKETDKIIKTAMAKDPALRYSTATELAHALTVAAFGAKGDTSARAGGATAVGARAQSAEAAQSARGGRRGLIIGGAIVLLLLLAGAAVLLGGKMLAPAPPTSIPQPPTAAPVVPAVTTRPTAQFTETAAVQYAPVCAPGVVPQIPAPVVAEVSRTCNNKLAITGISIPRGATYEIQKAGYVCEPFGVPGANQLIACHGTNLTMFDIKVCIPLPTPASSVVVGACQAGTEYNYTNACCAPAAPKDSNCTTYTVSLGACGG